MNGTPRRYTYETIPEELRAVHAWVLWRKVWREDKQKFDKVPTQINGYPASITNRAHFSAFAHALAAYQLGVGDGLGFCFTGDDDFVFVDLDGAVANGAWNPQHLPILQAFPTWAELSQSGKGLHLICRGRLERARVHHPAGIELYSSGRFVALTGWRLDGWAEQITEQQLAVDRLAAYLDELKGAEGVRPVEPAGPTPPLAEVVPSLATLGLGTEVRAFLEYGDAAKWEHDRSRALLAASMSLYRAGLDDSQVLTVMWAHCNHIATEHRAHGDAIDWLWKYNVARARHAAPPSSEELFEAVPTAQPDYTGDLIRRAQHLSGSVDAASITEARKILAECLNLDAGSRAYIKEAVRKAMAWSRSDLNEISKELAREHRKLQQSGSHSLDKVMSDYIYVASQHQFLHKPSGDMFKPEAFLALHMHVTPELREISLNGQGLAKVHGVDFQPGEGQFFRRHEGLYYNTWSGLADRGAPGDVTPWWNHLCMLVRNEHEREHLLNCMAFVLQNPGVKINHGVIFSGSQGQGKDSLFWPLCQALGKHAKQVAANALAGDFNDYLLEAKVVVFQEIDMGSRKEASAVANRMKPYFAAPPDTLYINPKGARAFYISNVVFVIAFTNEVHPAHIQDKDRRYFVLHSDINVYDAHGQQTPEWAQYFRQFWAWLDAGNGWRAVVHYLLHRNIAGFNPKAAPPMTQAKQDIIGHSRSSLESLLANAIRGRVSIFQADVVNSRQVLSWLATEGAGLMQMYGVRENPSLDYLARVLRTCGAQPVASDDPMFPNWRIR